MVSGPSSYLPVSVGRLDRLITRNRVANKDLVDLSDGEIDELVAIAKTTKFRCCHPNWTGYGSLGFPDCE